jgi:hypothetical protein
MENEKFFKSNHCKSEVHCKSCRNIDDSDFRQMVVNNFSDVTSLKFECPYIKPWGFSDAKEKVSVFTARNVRKNKKLFKHIVGLKEKKEEVNNRIEEANCSKCVANSMRQEIVTYLFEQIMDTKDIDTLRKINQKAVVKLGRKVHKISDLTKRLEDELHIIRE